MHLNMIASLPLCVFHVFLLFCVCVPLFFHRFVGFSCFVLSFCFPFRFLCSVFFLTISDVFGCCFPMFVFRCVSFCFCFFTDGFSFFFCLSFFRFVFVFLSFCFVFVTCCRCFPVCLPLFESFSYHPCSFFSCCLCFPRCFSLFPCFRSFLCACFRFQARRDLVFVFVRFSCVFTVFVFGFFRFLFVFVSFFLFFLLICSFFFVVVPLFVRFVLFRFVSRCFNGFRVCIDFCVFVLVSFFFFFFNVFRLLLFGVFLLCCSYLMFLLVFVLFVFCPFVRFLFVFGSCVVRGVDRTESLDPEIKLQGGPSVHTPGKGQSYLRVLAVGLAVGPGEPTWAMAVV